MLALAWPLTLLLAVVSAAAQEQGTSYDGTKIANRTIERTAQLRTHSIYAPYIDQDLQNRWWDFGADAYVNTNKHIRLTQNKPHQMGWLWSRLPLTAHSWVLEVEFKIGDKSTHLYGDGLAIWVTKERAQPGPVFGSKDHFNGLGVFLDTYANGRHTFSFPRIFGMLGDGATKYDHDTDGETNASKLGACSANFRRTTVPTKLKISYAKDTHLDVKIQYKGWDEWTNCFSADNVKLPVHPYVGFSALTGDVSDPHDIISVTLSSVVLSSPDAQRNSLKKTKGSILGSGSSSSSGFFWKLLLLIGVCVGAWYGWKMYGQKRFGSPFGGTNAVPFGGPSRGGLGGGSPYGGFGGGPGWENGKRY